MQFSQATLDSLFVIHTRVIKDAKWDGWLPRLLYWCTVTDHPKNMQRAYSHGVYFRTLEGMVGQEQAHSSIRYRELARFTMLNRILLTKAQIPPMSWATGFLALRPRNARSSPLKPTPMKYSIMHLAKYSGGFYLLCVSSLCPRAPSKIAHSIGIHGMTNSNVHWSLQILPDRDPADEDFQTSSLPYQRVIPMTCCLEFP